MVWIDHRCGSSSTAWSASNALPITARYLSHTLLPTQWSCQCVRPGYNQPPTTSFYPLNCRTAGYLRARHCPRQTPITRPARHPKCCHPCRTKSVQLFFIQYIPQSLQRVVPRWPVLIDYRLVQRAPDSSWN